MTNTGGHMLRPVKNLKPKVLVDPFPDHRVTINTLVDTIVSLHTQAGFVPLHSKVVYLIQLRRLHEECPLELLKAGILRAGERAKAPWGINMIKKCIPPRTENLAPVEEDIVSQIMEDWQL